MQVRALFVEEIHVHVTLRRLTFLPRSVSGQRPSILVAGLGCPDVPSSGVMNRARRHRARIITVAMSACLPRYVMYVDINQITEKLQQFRDDRDWRRHHSLRNLAMALNVEASELLELLQWVDDDQVEAWLTAEQHQAAVTDEIADIFIYLTYLVDHLGIDLEAAVLRKIERNAARFPTVFEPATGQNDEQVQS